jgi:flagellar biosynthesis/type III secretory pathway M-ring protein FliF/YscJ
VGTNVLWSAAVFLLLFVLWYFHKRGKEEREKREKEEAEAEAEGKEGKEGKEGDPEEGTSSAVVVVEPPVESPRV